MSRVAATLARLAKIDPEPDANTHPRPAGSLADVFNLYDPQTSVPFARRLDELDGLRRRPPAEAWWLLRAILPTRLTIFTVVPSAVEIMGSGPARDLSVDLFGHRPRLPGIAPLDHSRYDAALRSACQEAVCAVLDSEGITGLLTVAASASVTPPPPRRKAEVVTVIEHGRQAKALEAFGFRVLVGQQTRWFKASDFIVHQAKGGSFKLEYAPYGKATGMYLMAGPRGSILVHGDEMATSLREGLANAQGYAELFTVQVQGHRIGVLYLDDFHGQLVEAPAAYWCHAPQPTEWRLVPVQGYHFGR